MNILNYYISVKHLIGMLLLSIPFVLMTIKGAHDVGFKFVCLCWAAILIATALFFCGLYLLST